MSEVNSEPTPVQAVDLPLNTTPGAGANLPWFLMGAVTLVVMTLAFYSPSLRGTFIWDDALHVTRNPQLFDMTGLQNVWFKPGSTPQYYPLTYTSFWIEKKIWGDNSAGYKLVNILLHA